MPPEHYEVTEADTEQAIKSMSHEQISASVDRAEVMRTASSIMPESQLGQEFDGSFMEKVVDPTKDKDLSLCQFKAGGHKVEVQYKTGKNLFDQVVIDGKQFESLDQIKRISEQYIPLINARRKIEDLNSQTDGKLREERGGSHEKWVLDDIFGG